MHEIVEIEERGWRALATEADAARIFYASVLREDAVMLFPGGLRIEGRQRILESLRTQPWESYRIENTQVIQLNGGAATIVYKATALRKGNSPYTALISSTYVREGDWKLVIHHQTPV